MAVNTEVILVREETSTTIRTRIQGRQKSLVLKAAGNFLILAPRVLGYITLNFRISTRD
jgi:hypothetical protein